MDVTVCIGTFGDQEWIRLAEERAVPSIPGDVPFTHAHEKTLAQARNAAAAAAKTEYLCFLDADDQLAPGYFEAMAKGSADLRGPGVKYAARHPSPSAVTRLEMGDLWHRNFLVIGTLVRRELFERVGGFREEPIYEDYALWCRCAAAGASIEMIYDAVYLAWARRDSRNRAPDMRWKNDWHFKIREAVWPERAAA